MTVPELLLGPDDGSWGDERERSVLLDGYAYIYILGSIALWVLGAVAAWFIPIWVTIALWLVLVVPAWEWQRFAKARGVDAQALAYARAARTRMVLLSVLVGACSVSMGLAVWGAVVPDDGSSGLVVWTIVGGVVGGAVGGSVTFLAKRRRAKATMATADAGDDVDH
ncbi:hypothetical protein ABLE92_11020 [Gordonia sp. VNQ95]|uniref:hypothetical protein n=1 Tax=Gordonia TaxID=2053 RepID=UPI0032B32D90